MIGHPNAQITGLSEEHGVIVLQEDSHLTVGDRIRIVPNHVCVVANMFDEVWLETSAGDYLKMKTDARGRVT